MPWKDRDARIAGHKRDKARLKAEFLAAYGGKCACCGEAEPRFLSIDHIDGRSPAEYGRGSDTLRLARREGWPPKYQILCYNCNCAKGFFGVCPHQEVELSN